MGCGSSVGDELIYTSTDAWHLSGPNTADNVFPREFRSYDASLKKTLPCTDNQKQAECDVFYVHSSSTVGLKRESDIEQRIKEIEMHASLFNNCCKVYAPRFHSAKSVEDLQGLNRAYDDVLRAWEHYLSNWAGTRPFILAGHGQGSYLLLKLVIAEMINKTTEKAADLRRRLVCAYLPGTPVKMSEFKTEEKGTLIRCGLSSRDTGCVVSWHTYYGITKTNPVNYFYPGERGEYTGALVESGMDDGGGDEKKSDEKWVCVNPLGWNLTETVKGRKNMGSMDREGALTPSVIGASLVDDGGCVQVVLESNADVKFSGTSDYEPFWMSVRLNAAERVSAWVGQQMM